MAQNDVTNGKGVHPISTYWLMYNPEQGLYRCSMWKMLYIYIHKYKYIHTNHNKLPNMATITLWICINVFISYRFIEVKFIFPIHIKKSLVICHGTCPKLHCHNQIQETKRAKVTESAFTLLLPFPRRMGRPVYLHSTPTNLTHQNKINHPCRSSLPSIHQKIVAFKMYTTPKRQA